MFFRRFTRVAGLVPTRIAAAVTASTRPEEKIKSAVRSVIYREVRAILSNVLPVRIEIWIEKSGAADIIEPAAEKYFANTFISTGNA